MSLQKELEQQGNYLFKYRGTLPVIILLTALIVFAVSLHYAAIPPLTGFWDLPFELVCLGVSLLGLIVRVYTVGYTPKNTSGRNTEGQLADTVNKTGIYSIVRHPLYVGNFFMWLGIALLTRHFWFNVSFVFIYWIYYERIMYAEEQFLKRKFGDAYLKWASKTPAFVPSLKNWTSPALSFSIKKVIKKEKNGIAALFLIFYLFELLGVWVETGEFALQKSVWFYALIAGTIFYIIVKILTKRTAVLDEPGR